MPYPPGIKANLALLELKAAQNAIKRLYPELVAQYSRQFCPVCKYQMTCGLMPVTSTGQKCPYYRP